MSGILFFIFASCHPLNHCTIKTPVFCTAVHTYFVYGIKLRNQASVNNCKAVHSLLLIDVSGFAVREQ